MNCQHDINIKDNTVSLLRRRFLALPGKVCGKCKCCSKVFTYILNEDGLFVKEEDCNHESERRDIQANE